MVFTGREVVALREALENWDRHQMNPYTEDALISGAAKFGAELEAIYPSLHGKDDPNA